MKLPLKLLVFLIFFLAFESGFAEKMDLSKTNILVKTNDRNDQNSLKLAFAQILANHSGEAIEDVLKNHVISETNIKSGIKRSYFERIPFQYQNQESEYQFWFHVVMDESFIQRALVDGDFGLWPDMRSKTHVMIAEENPLDGLNHSEKEAFDYWLKKWAESHAIQIDIIKNTSDNLSPTQIKNLSHNLIPKAKDQYNSDQLSLIYVNTQNDMTKIRSGFSINQGDYLINHFNGEPKELSSLMYQVVSATAQNIANTQRFNHTEISRHTVQILVENVGSYTKKMQLQKTLDSLSVIENYEIIKAGLDQLTLRANVKIKNQSLINLFAKNHLTQKSNSSNINQLNFIWDLE